MNFPFIPSLNQKNLFKEKPFRDYNGNFITQSCTTHLLVRWRLPCHKLIWQLRKQLCLSKPRENFFTNRASLWNELPDTVVSAKSTNAFKDKFDEFRSQQLAANDTTIVE
ncbi:hypothetical protein BpHYR1_000340 [Brachionus plicatilis]|uniref:RNA-directed DNA polymerase from mobile element jockey-like n=1 Tax=Brachionus plicatilis TaxID=10195 RepID=A0A3M7SCH7_BRAPC|nr:hypothetical protein BpHYR1_000340 [Brachionus plicatilis]